MVCITFGANPTAANRFIGELRSIQGTTRAYSNTMGKGNKTGAQGIIQISVRRRKATRRAQVITQCCADSTSRSRAREGA